MLFSTGNMCTVEFSKEEPTADVFNGTIELYPEYNIAKLDIEFPYTSTNLDFSENRWIGIGFSRDQFMVSSFMFQNNLYNVKQIKPL